MRQPASTSNPEAAALIRLAQSKCAGCAQSWRLDLRRNSGFTHSGNIACTAPEERIQLRDLARKARQ